MPRVRNYALVKMKQKEGSDDVDDDIVYLVGLDDEMTGRVVFMIYKQSCVASLSFFLLTQCHNKNNTKIGNLEVTRRKFTFRRQLMACRALHNPNVSYMNEMI